MAQFQYHNDLTSQYTLDGDLSGLQKPRWKKKQEKSFNMNNSTANHSKLSVSYNTSYAAVNNTTLNKTPNKQGNAGSSGKDIKPSGRKTPTPNKNGSKTPTGACGDRFIPNRSAINFEIGNYLIKREEQKKESGNENDSNIKGSSEEKTKMLSEAIHGLDISKKRILAFQNKAPAPPDSHLNPMRVVFSTKTPSSSKGGTRYIPSNPERILDAPDITNDYYLNLLDWNKDNTLTVALGQSVYLWNAGSGSIDVLFDNEGSKQTTSLAWIQEGSILAVGTSEGKVELWDCAKMKRLREMEGHDSRVGSLAWNSFVVTSGSRDGTIIHHDVRTREHIIQRLHGHTQEVCGLKWSPDFKYLASGGNDNIVNIWAAEANGKTSDTPIFVFNEHQAAVRALAWCPWQPNILATGGGTADRCIKFWNVNNGTCLNTVDTKSQVCSLIFSSQYKEIISAHGYANNQLTIWKYPSMQKQIDLTGHTSRILQLAMSPDGTTVISAGADETLRLWKCFAPDPTAAHKKKTAHNENESIFCKQNIR